MKKLKSNNFHKRRIPAIGIDPQFAIESSDILGDLSFKEMAYHETTAAIREAYRTKQKSAVLFQLNNENCYFEIPKSEWRPAITVCLEQLEKKEDFEGCAELKEILNNI